MFTPLAFTKESIVTRGLIFHVDAADRTSYSPSSNKWNDLVGSNSATLVNGPAFDSEKGGSITFDRVNDYAITSNFNEDTNDGLSVFTWVKIESVGSYLGVDYSFLVNKRNNGSDRQWQLNYRDGVVVGQIFNGSTTISSFPTNNLYTIDLNEWYYIGFTTEGTNGGTTHTYHNGRPDGSVTLTNDRGKGSRPIALGTTAWDLGSYLGLDGNLAHVKIYNRVLTPQEVTQNYNALKGRFGL